jgi:hypothetical protein
LQQVAYDGFIDFKAGFQISDLCLQRSALRIQEVLLGRLQLIAVLLNFLLLAEEKQRGDAILRVGRSRLTLSFHN